jgi:peptidoglycan/LPS O-acetylase OafA/YrhL
MTASTEAFVAPAIPATATTDAPATTARHGLVRLDSLTGLRFFAALMVILSHTIANPNHSGIVDIPVLEPIATLGYTGVAFFFVLSGFVLTWSWRPERGKGDFWLRRVARVYPLHAITWLLAVPLAIYLGTTSGVGDFFSGLFLVQAWSPNESVAFAYNAPSWSLACEAFFYAMFPLLIIPLARLDRRRLAGVIVASLAFLALVPAIAYVVGGGRDAVAIFYYFPAYRLGEFVIGICLALLIRDGWRPPVPRWTGFALVGAGFVAALVADELFVRAVDGSESLPRPAAALILIPAFALLIVVAAAGDLDGNRSFYSRPFVVKLGEWSFAAYLSHLMVVQFVKRAAGDALPDSGVAAWAVELGLLVLFVAVAALIYTLIERPLERLLRQRFTKSPEPSITTA